MGPAASRHRRLPALRELEVMTPMPVVVKVIRTLTPKHEDAVAEVVTKVKAPGAVCKAEGMGEEAGRVRPAWARERAEREERRALVPVRESGPARGPIRTVAVDNALVIAIRDREAAVGDSVIAPVRGMEVEDVLAAMGMVVYLPETPTVRLKGLREVHQTECPAELSAAREPIPHKRALALPGSTQRAMPVGTARKTAARASRDSADRDDNRLRVPAIRMHQAMAPLVVLPAIGKTEIGGRMPVKVTVVVAVAVRVRVVHRVAPLMARRTTGKTHLIRLRGLPAMPIWSLAREAQGVSAAGSPVDPDASIWAGLVKSLLSP